MYAPSISTSNRPLKRSAGIRWTYSELSPANHRRSTPADRRRPSLVAALTSTFCGGEVSIMSIPVRFPRSKHSVERAMHFKHALISGLIREGSACGLPGQTYSMAADGGLPDESVEARPQARAGRGWRRIGARADCVPCARVARVPAARPRQRRRGHLP